MASSDLEKGAVLNDFSPQPPHLAYNTSGSHGSFLPAYEEHLNTNLRNFAEPESSTSASPIIIDSPKLNSNRRRLVLQGLCVLAFLLVVLGAGAGLALGLKSKVDCSNKVLRPYLPFSTIPRPLQWEKRSIWTNATQQMSNKQTRSDGTVTFHPYTTTVYISAIAPMTSTRIVVVAAPSAQLLPTSTEVTVETVTSTAMVVISSSEMSVSALPFTLPTGVETLPTSTTSASATSTPTSTTPTSTSTSTPTSTSTSTSSSEAPPPPPPVTVTVAPPPAAINSPVMTATRRVGWCGVTGEACA